MFTGVKAILCLAIFSLKQSKGDVLGLLCSCHELGHCRIAGHCCFCLLLLLSSPGSYLWGDAVGPQLSLHHHPSYEVCGPTFKDIAVTIFSGFSLVSSSVS